MAYDSSPRSYESRIQKLLQTGDEASLLYAALELRCGVEARMKEYLDPLDHIPKAHKKEYSVVKLGRTVDNAFQKKDQICLFTILFPDDGEKLTLRYIPVPKRLQDIAARAGDALHFPGEANADDPEWWGRLRTTIEEGWRWFSYVAEGELIGIPLINKKTQQLILRAVLPLDDVRRAGMRRLPMGAVHHISVAYEPMPIEPPVKQGGRDDHRQR